MSPFASGASYVERPGMNVGTSYGDEKDIDYGFA